MKSVQSKKFLWFALIILFFAGVLVVLWYVYQRNSNSQVIPTPPDSQKVATSSLEEWQQITTQAHFGWPRSSKKYLIREFSAYSLGYDENKKQAAWVAYELLPSETTGLVGRRPGFRQDPEIDQGPSPEDYTNSGYDRGHLAPAADFSFSRQALEETFYMSNISPQEPDFNRGIWRQLEEQIRRWSQEKGRLWVLSGPLFGQRNRRIGPNRVAVPRGFYKAVFAPDAQPPLMIGFYLANQYSAEELSTFSLKVDSIEILCQCDAYSSLPDSLETQLEDNLDLSKWF